MSSTVKFPKLKYLFSTNGNLDKFEQNGLYSLFSIMKETNKAKQIRRINEQLTLISLIKKNFILN